MQVQSTSLVAGMGSSSATAAATCELVGFCSAKRPVSLCVSASNETPSASESATSFVLVLIFIAPGSAALRFLCRGEVSSIVGHPSLTDLRPYTTTSHLLCWHNFFVAAYW